ncbi:carbamoyl phosphate synthase large subunit [Geobacillus thermodenitrificans]|uniref:Carbamoyl phosphate synthase large chain n=1 Tax=Geobacillus thermodenitrificans TaxID=33940 RepID=A0ABY9QDM4_GEOTD|nr:carbamoyl phosphate synthase large subunit [Geobacillus thermodenitrificans]MEC5188978.1 carbamoyl-phosphate synthase large subunit [Geobacillus thermodenitrificans]MED0664031.1 carbamoyl-phosphate synthase large subunit [Geobacillus thermodenitrificans]PTR47298.1 carbamoyl-phosphate synthase large subunit [Geobacillus thermodenitrificans]WMV77003.1 carbamoyl phosphate synthase large subunit [Geobacillus thermodenitrificans]
MPKDSSLQSILLIGSGPIVIGQAAEFDYSGTQACIALKEEGYRVILVNNNPATIMTDDVHADAVYFEPLTVDAIEAIIAKERPDGLLATFGGQTGLNLAFQLYEAGVLEKYGVRLLGTPIEAIKRGEDREAFRALMHELGEPVPESEIVTNVKEAVAFAEQIGFPIIIRPAYTLGGTGGGIAENMEQFIALVEKGLAESPIRQCLIERSVAGFKEIEYEVMRDQSNTCITVCNMENVDPVGVHTGDSIVVAPSQTLTDEEYQMLRSSAVKIISALGIIGGCNIQFALDPNSKQYYLIEVNPRVSRSSALASKATGYPIARIAAKLAVGYTLAELINPVTKTTYASFEPALDYVVVKFPRLPFDKFPHADRKLGTQMKATGEVMAIDRNMERAFQKAVQSLEGKNNGLFLSELSAKTNDELKQLLVNKDDRRFFAILELLRRGVTVETIHEWTKIDRFFLCTFERLVALEKQAAAVTLDTIDETMFRFLKEKGASDAFLAETWGVTELEVRNKRKELGIVPSYKMVDTCAAEFHSETDYYYSAYFGEDERKQASGKEKVLIIGAGPIRIGQGIEFDYSSVHSVFALQKEGYETIMINNNPETVSTDFAIADRLYFEPLTLESVLDVIEAEQIQHVIVQFGGQTAINLVKGLEEAGVRLLGVTYDIIDQLEDRDRFYQLLEELDIPHVPGLMANDAEELVAKAAEIGYPVLLRPSYVIGGRGMFIIRSEAQLAALIEQGELTYPILIDAYLDGKEAEADIVTDGTDILLPTIIEHVEKAGVHSGDSYAWLPAQTLTEEERANIVDYAGRIARKLGFKGIMNIQYVIADGNVYVLEVNPRASRTVPIVSKTTGVPLAQIATKLLLGKSLVDIPGGKMSGLTVMPYVVLKYPVFSTYKLPGVDPTVGPEMKSTGEGISIAMTKEEAAYKAFYAYLQKKANANELYVIGDIDAELAAEIETKQLNIVTDVSFADWVKRDGALAVIDLRKEEGEAPKRMAALSQQLLVFTERETLDLFLQALTVGQLDVQPISGWIKKKKQAEQAVIA